MYRGKRGVGGGGGGVVVRILRPVHSVSYNFKLTVLERTTLEQTRHNSTLGGDEKEEGKRKIRQASFTFIPIAYCLLVNKYYQ